VRIAGAAAVTVLEGLDISSGATPAGSRHVVVALQVGAASIRAALVDRSAVQLAVEAGMTPQTNTPDLLEAIALLAGRLIAQACGEGLVPVGVGVAVPGIVDEELGLVRRSANLVWKDVALRQILADRLRLPVVLEQDARAGARGEALLGAGRYAPDFLFMVVGDGIGSAVVLDGHPRTGVHGVAGEVGHIRVREDGLPCGCGGHGCAETLATGDLTGVAEILDDGAGGASAATVVWRDAMAGLASSMAAAVAVLDCSLVVLGGRLATSAGERLVRSLQTELGARLSLVPPPDLQLARLGDAASLMGVASSAFEAAGLPAVAKAWRTLARPA
jgi:glucokinase